MIRLTVILVCVFFSNAYAYPNSFAPTVEKANPAVVSISAVSDNEMQIPRRLGSGFIIEDNGYVLTNYHVVNQADEVEVKTDKENIYQAKVVGKDELNDLALLKIDSKKSLPFIELVDSASSKIGEWIVVIGKPISGEPVVNAGIISSKSTSSDGQEFIQTNLLIHQGMSGGPLLNMDGKAIGIIQPIMINRFSSMSVAFATPSNDIIASVKQLKDNGKITHKWLGVVAQSITDDIVKAMNYESKKGVLVSTVISSSPAEKAGIIVGDVILNINGMEVTDIDKLLPAVRKSSIGKATNIDIIRDNNKKTLSVILEEPKISSIEKDQERDVIDTKAQDVMGLNIVDLDEQLIKKYNLKQDLKGVLVTSFAVESPFSGLIMDGDIISQINQQKIENTKALADELKILKDKGDKSAVILCLRDMVNAFITIKL